MNALKECLSLILIILAIISLTVFDYALFGIAGDSRQAEEKQATTDSQEVCFKIKTANLEDGNIYLEQKGVS